MSQAKPTWNNHTQLRQRTKTEGIARMLSSDFKRNRWIYVMLLPVVLYYLIFHYAPMYGAIIAFKQFSPVKGIWGSDWVGLKHFYDFFDSIYIWRVLKNTLLLNVYSIVFAFPAPIILALLLNEIRVKRFKSLVQTVTYLPHFISTVIICGLLVQFMSSDGFITDIIVWLGGERSPLLSHAEYFRTIFISSDIWKEVGWSSIIYLAALSGINPDQYEAATIDGAGRFKQLLHVTIPGLMPIIAILLILRIGNMMDVGFEKIILLYNPNTYETADVISSFVYRRGIAEGAQFSFTSAVGLFQSVINFILLISANWITRRMQGSSLW